MSDYIYRDGTVVTSEEAQLWGDLYREAVVEAKGVRFTRGPGTTTAPTNRWNWIVSYIGQRFEDRARSAGIRRGGTREQVAATSQATSVLHGADAELRARSASLRSGHLPPVHPHSFGNEEPPDGAEQLPNHGATEACRRHFSDVHGAGALNSIDNRGGHAESAPICFATDAFRRHFSDGLALASSAGLCGLSATNFAVEYARGRAQLAGEPGAGALKIDNQGGHA